VFFIGHEVLLATGRENITQHNGDNSGSAYQEASPPFTEPEVSLSY
jgi:hypothetical protein